MRFKKGVTFVYAMVTAVMVMAGAASANHTDFSTWTLSDYHTSVYATHSSTITFGSTIATTMTTDIAAGFDIKYTEPLDGDVVATGTATAKWVLLFCSSSTQNLTGKWQHTPDSGAPAGSVAQINMSNALGFTTKVFVVKQATADYKLVIPTMPSNQICSSTTNGSTSLTVNGIVSGTTRHVVQNPSTTGTYTSTTTYTDTAGNSHTDNVSVTII